MYEASIKSSYSGNNWQMKQVENYLRKISFTNNIPLKITQTDGGFLWREISFKFEGTAQQMIALKKILEDFNKLNEVD